MKKIIYIALMALLPLFLGCQNNTEQKINKIDPTTVRIAMGAEPESLDLFVIIAADSEAIFANVFNALLTYTETGDLINDLASDIAVNSDNSVFTITLHPNVLFHNGQSLTSADVVYTFNRYRELRSAYSTIAKVEALDELTVRFTLNGSDASFPYLLATTWIAPQGYNNQALHPVGSGSYMFTSYTPGRIIELERNPHYFKTEQELFFKKAHFIVATESLAAVMAVQGGSLDLVSEVDASSLSASMKSQLQVVPAPQNLTVLLALNNARPPFNNPLVRQAFNHAVDKQQVLDLVLSGNGVLLDTGLSSVMVNSYNHDLANFYPYNRAKAHELLTKAGYPDGLTVTIRVPSNYKPHVDAAQVLAAQLALVGVRVIIEPIEWALWLEDVHSNRNFEATVIGLTGKLSPFEQLVRFSPTGFYNFMNYGNPEFDELLEQARRSPDPKTQNFLLKQAQQLLADDAVAVFLYDPSWALVANPWLKGLKTYPIKVFRISDYSY
jgi:peptide/nickel transport system substrate-binding protein